MGSYRLREGEGWSKVAVSAGGGGQKIEGTKQAEGDMYLGPYIGVGTRDMISLGSENSPLGHQDIGCAQSATPHTRGFFPLVFPPQGCNPTHRAVEVRPLGIRFTAFTGALFH